MRYIKEFVEERIEINKSIFVGLLYPLEKIEDIETFLLDAKTKYPKATHYCQASIFGVSGEQQTASDDGEPSRTAGVPMLEVLKHHDVTNVLLIVVRYFGGIKLGAGGLVRAYSKASSAVIQKASFYEKITVPTYKLTFSYENMQKIDKHLENDCNIVEKVFLENVTYKVTVHTNNKNIIEEIKYLLINFEELDDETLFV